MRQPRSPCSQCGVYIFNRTYLPEVHGLLGHDVDAHLLRLRLAQHVVLPRDVTHDGVRLGAEAKESGLCACDETTRYGGPT